MKNCSIYVIDLMMIFMLIFEFEDVCWVFKLNLIISEWSNGKDFIWFDIVIIIMKYFKRWSIVCICNGVIRVF